ncbi:hypothetical protein Tco_0221817 [Tanacetum coccineum]
MNYNNLVGRSFHPGDIVDWEFLSNKGIVSHSSTSSIPIPSLDHNGYEPLHKCVTFRLGGVEREMSLLELGWRVGLYSKGESRYVATLSGLRGAEIVNSTRLTYLFWPSIGDGRYNVGYTKAKSIMNPRIKLAHRCITMTIMGRKESTSRVIKIELFYLYCIFREGVVCNIPYWLAKYLKSENSLVKIGIIMKLHEGECCWPATREVMEEGKGDDEEGDGKRGNKGVEGSADIYRNMSQGYDADYPPVDYQGYMPPGYAYRPDPSHDGSS